MFVDAVIIVLSFLADDDVVFFPFSKHFVKIHVNVSLKFVKLCYDLNYMYNGDYCVQKQITQQELNTSWI